MLSLDLLNGIINKYFDTNFKGVEDALKRRQKVGKLQKIIINKYCKQYKIIKLGHLTSLPNLVRLAQWNFKS